MSHGFDFRQPRVYRVEEGFGEDRMVRGRRQHAVRPLRTQPGLRSRDGSGCRGKIRSGIRKCGHQGTRYIKHAATLRDAHVRKCARMLPHHVPTARGSPIPSNGMEMSSCVTSL